MLVPEEAIPRQIYELTKSAPKEKSGCDFAVADTNNIVDATNTKNLFIAKSTLFYIYTNCQCKMLHLLFNVMSLRYTEKVRHL